jgi:hypothetical protein
MFINLKFIGGNMVKFNLVPKLVFLGLLVKFWGIPHTIASSDVDCKSSDFEVTRRGGSSSSEISIIDRPDAIFTSGMSTEAFLTHLSAVVEGNAMEPSQKSIDLHRQILDGIVRYTVSTLNTLSPAAPESRVIVGKLINIWLLHRSLPAGCNWLNFVKDENGKKLPKNEAIQYLIGERGVITVEFTPAGRSVLTGSRRGTTLQSLTELFCTAAANFQAALLIEKGFVQEQRNLLARTREAFFVGSRRELSMFDVLDAALTAAIEQQSARGDLVERVARIEGRLDTLEKYLQTPVTLGVNVVFNLWGRFPLHKKIEALWKRMPGHETIEETVMGIPVLGDALLAL